MPSERDVPTLAACRRCAETGWKRLYRSPRSPRREYTTARRTAPPTVLLTSFACQRTPRPERILRSPATFFASRPGISSSGRRFWVPGRFLASRTAVLPGWTVFWLPGGFFSFPAGHPAFPGPYLSSRTAILRSGAPSLLPEPPSLKSGPPGCDPRRHPASGGLIPPEKRSGSGVYPTSSPPPCLSRLAHDKIPRPINLAASLRYGRPRGLACASGGRFCINPLTRVGALV